MATFYGNKPLKNSRKKGAMQAKHAARRFSERFGDVIRRANLSLQ